MRTFRFIEGFMPVQFLLEWVEENEKVSGTNTL
jgi:hypothetical protein